MRDKDETQATAVLLAAAVVILVIAYCRLAVGDAKGGSAAPRWASAALVGEKADSEGR